MAAARVEAVALVAAAEGLGDSSKMVNMKKILLIFACLLPALAFAQEPDTTAKLNKKNLVIKEWKTDARSGKKMLDHVTTYNPEGRKAEEIEYNADGQKWRKRYEYDASGRQKKELVYDEKDRLVSIKKFEYNEFGRKKVQYTYDAKGKLKSIKNFEYIAGDA